MNEDDLVIEELAVLKALGEELPEEDVVYLEEELLRIGEPSRKLHRGPLYRRGTYHTIGPRGI